jgi:thiol-disulfide isomerase/thioredoxin
MKKAEFYGTKTSLSGLVFVLIFSFGIFAQKKAPTPKPTPNANLPKVTQIDEVSLKTALKPNGKPLLVNFWATWCDPCREEFPDLVRIDAAYKGKIDFITVSLDDLAEINRDVPKFLSEMKAEMPAFLLKTADESAVISAIAKDWNGGLPFTILYNEKGEIAYFQQGKVKTDVVKAEIEKLIASKPAALSETAILELPQRKLRSTDEGLNDAKKDIADGFLKIKRYGFSPGTAAESTQNFNRKYGIEIISYGCVLIETPEYFKAYNETMKAEILKRFGAETVNNLPF